MKIRYLGTAAAEGWPAVFCQCEPCLRSKEQGGKNVRTRSSILIDDHTLVDFPPDTYLHVLRDGLDLGKVRRLFVTHSHEDHFYPQDLAMRSEPYSHLKEDEKLTLWGNAVVVGMIQRGMVGLEFDMVAARIIAPKEMVQTGGLTVTALLAKHTEPEESLLYIFDDGQKAFFHAYDSGWYPAETWEMLAGRALDLVNFDCTHGPISNRYGGHMGIPEVLAAREKMLELGAIKPDAKCVITHFTHNCGLLHQELEKEVSGSGLIVAYDGMELEI